MNNKEREKYQVQQNNMYATSNVLISSKYKSTLFSNRLMAISMAKIFDGKAEEDAVGGLSLRIPGSEIQKKFGSSSHDFFNDLDKAANSMTGRSIGWSNPETREFEYTAVVTNAKFVNNVFTIEFNKNMTKYLKDLDSQYTMLQLPVMLSFKSVYTFRLYEILKSKSYTPKGSKNTENKYRIEMDLNELRLMLGVVNAELESVKKVLNNRKGNPDYEAAVNASPEKIFVQWYELKRNCIDVAVKEINKNPETGMHVDYEAKKMGRGGKVYAVEFFVDLISKTSEDVAEEAAELNEYNEDDILEEIMMKLGIKLKEARSVAVAANWDLNIVMEKYEISKSQDIDNLVGWMIKAIKEDYKMPSGKKSKKSVKTGFSNFEERDVDYNEIEDLFIK